MLSWLASLVVILLLGYALYVYGGVRPGFAPIAACSLIALSVLFFGMLNLLLPGTVLVWLGCIVLGIAALRSNPSCGKAYITAPAILAFVLGSLIIGGYSFWRDSYYVQFDDFSHWGMFFKALFTEHKLHVYYDSNLWHPSYPQAIHLFYYFASRLSPAFSEPETFAAMGTVLNASAAAMLFAVDWKKPIASVLGIAGVPLFYLLFPVTWPYITIYQDALLGAVFGAVLIAAMATAEDHCGDHLAMALSCAFLAQLKATGWMFALSAAAVYLLIHLPAMLRQRTRRRSMMRRCGAVLLPTLLFTGIWQLILQLTGTAAEERFSAPERPGLVQQLALLAKGENEFAASVLERFQINFCYMPVVYNGYGTPLVITVLLLAGFAVAGVVLVRSHRGNLLLALFSMPLYLLAYSASLIVSYLTLMSDFEALLNASSDRYLCSYFIGWIMLILALYYQIGERLVPVVGKAIPAGIAAVVLLLQVNYAVQNDALALAENRQNSGRIGFDSVSAQMAEHLERDDRIWLIACDLNAMYLHMYHYTLWPAQVSLELPFTNDESFPTEQAQLHQLIAEHGVTHFVVYQTNDAFVQAYGGLFSDGLAYVAQHSLPCLYRVTGQGSFELVTETKI